MPQNSSTKRSSSLSIPARLGLALVLIAGLLSAMPVQTIQAVSYTDTFATRPPGLSIPAPSFTTGTAATGLQYSSGISQLFSWGGTGMIDIDAGVGQPGSFTITSRDGKAFVFNSIWYQDDIGGTVITGTGPEPFTINIPLITSGTFSPSGGPKLVTQVEISNSTEMWALMDDVDVELDVPGMDVQGNSTTIVNGDSPPSTGDDTDMGSTPVGIPVTKTFTIRSIGDASLDLTGTSPNYVTISGFSDLTISSQPTTDPIASGGSDTFTVRCNPSSSGVKTATVSIANDSEANPYTFSVQCTGTAAQEIDVQRPASTSIADGGTDNIGAQQVSTVSLTYTVENTGSANLTVNSPTASNFTNASSFSVTVAPSSPVSAGGSTTFTIQFDVDAGGVFSFDMGIGNNDSDENPYDIQITCTGDNDPPGLTSFARQTPATSPTNADTLLFRATFDEDVQNVDTGDFTVDGTTTATVTGVSTVSASVYDVTVSGGDLASFNGTVGLNLSGAQNITDLMGNALPAGEPATDETYTLDNDAPALTSFARQTPATSPTNADTLVFRVTFDEDVQNVGTADFSVNSTSTATVTGVSTVSDSVYDVTVSGGDLAGFNGTVGLDLDGAQDITDLAGNALPSSEPATDETYTVDNDGPTVTIDQAGGQADPTNSSPINFTVVFNESVSNFATGDVTLSGTAGATTATVTGSGTTYNVAVSGMTGDGTVIASIASGVATDAAGNDNAASTSTDNTVTYDATAPTPTITGPASPTNSDPFDVTIDFGETMTGFASGDITVGNGSVSSLTDDGGGQFTASIDATADGTVTVDIAASVAQDSAGNDNNAASQFSVDVDSTAPTPDIDQDAAQADPTNALPVNFDVDFGEDVSGFDQSDVNVGGTATFSAGPTVTVSGGPQTYDVSVNGTLSGDGTVTISIGAGAATDGAGNASNASTATDNSVTLDTTAPSPDIDQAGGQTDPTSTLPINFDVDFGENVTGFEAADVIIGGTAPGALAATVTGGPSQYNVAVSGLTGDGTVNINFNAGAAQDLVGNASTAPTLTDNEVTFDDNPEIDVQRPASTSIADGGTDNIGNQTVGTVNLTYTIDNTAGTDQLTVTGVTASNLTNVSNFSLNTATPINVAGGATATFDISFDVDTDGAFSLDMDIANNDADENPYDFAIQGTGEAADIYLPLVFKGYIFMPDLVVDSLIATSNVVTVTIRNAGNAPVNDEFWVDVYFNPSQTPPTVNHPWNTIASHGAVWGVTTPIPAGGTLVLTTGGDYYLGPPDSSAPPLPVGANVWALVDSVDYSTAYGAVQESNESNNHFGPVVSTASVGGAPSATQSQPVSREGLPPR